MSSDGSKRAGLRRLKPPPKDLLLIVNHPVSLVKKCELQELLIFDSLSVHVAFRDMCAAILADDIICIQEKNNQEVVIS